MALTATVTGVVGPAQALTAAVFTNVQRFELDCTEAEILTLFFNDGRQPQIIAVSAATTYTLTVTAPNTFALTVS